MHLPFHRSHVRRVAPGCCGCLLVGSYFEDRIQDVGGINVPKLVECHASDGRKYKQVIQMGSLTHGGQTALWVPIEKKRGTHRPLSVAQTNGARFA